MGGVVGESVEVEFGCGLLLGYIGEGDVEMLVDNLVDELLDLCELVGCGRQGHGIVEFGFLALDVGFDGASAMEDVVHCAVYDMLGRVGRWELVLVVGVKLWGVRLWHCRCCRGFGVWRCIWMVVLRTLL